MQLHTQQQQGILHKRYKRFLADIDLPDGKRLTVHCPNSGSMKGCSAPGSPVIISHSDNPKRKYSWTLEMVQASGVWVGVNTSLTNKIVAEALENGTIDEFGKLDTIHAEVKTSLGTRLDFRVHAQGQPVYIEVKNCSLAEGHTALFPDAVTTRGTKHLLELARLHEAGNAAAVLFCVQRADADRFSPAAHIDPEYAKTLWAVHDKGVQVLIYQARVTPQAITITNKLPLSENS
ncbi:MAG: DNA/RNA nuclease SfsA [Desulfobulbus propionicus]|nr:MAG: DNA/RNA nuclease SfsA [Desulfobulbus propionicus]